MPLYGPSLPWVIGVDWYSLGYPGSFLSNNCCIIKTIFKIKLLLTQHKYKFAVVYKIEITAGLTNIREVAVLYRSRG